MSVPSIVGVLGGTFDPVHRGHLEIATWLRSALRLPQLLLMPSALPPHKSPSDLTPARHRAAMLRLAVADHAELKLSTLELETRAVCYTIDTLRRLRDEGTRSKPIFVLGMDGLLDLPTWREFESLIREFDLVVLDRQDHRLDAVRSDLHPLVAARLFPCADLERVADELSNAECQGRIFPLRQTPIPISSSQIRERVAAGLDLDDLVPSAVARYIQVNRLYRQEGER